MIYLLSGTDEIFKQEKVQTLKTKLFGARDDYFNCEVIYGRDLNLPTFKEALGRLPVSSKNRLLIINDADKLKEDIVKYFLANYLSFPECLNLVLNASAIIKQNSFFSKVATFAKVFVSKPIEKKDAFGLADIIEKKQADDALRALADLFKTGVRPEMILGALRHKFMQASQSPKDRLKKINLLLETDIRIKTGKLKSEFALEALVVKLCS